jgi:hypothetical protein
VTLRIILAAIAAAAIAVGFSLPTFHGRGGDRPEPKSQIEQIDVARS